VRGALAAWLPVPPACCWADLQQGHCLRELGMQAATLSSLYTVRTGGLSAQSDKRKARSQRLGERKLAACSPPDSAQLNYNDHKLH
jgi:hypothetical protein